MHQLYFQKNDPLVADKLKREKLPPQKWHINIECILIPTLICPLVCLKGYACYVWWVRSKDSGYRQVLRKANVTGGGRGRRSNCIRHNSSTRNCVPALLWHGRTAKWVVSRSFGICRCHTLQQNYLSPMAAVALHVLCVIGTCMNWKVHVHPTLLTSSCSPFFALR